MAEHAFDELTDLVKRQHIEPDMQCATMQEHGAQQAPWLAGQRMSAFVAAPGEQQRRAQVHALPA